MELAIPENGKRFLAYLIDGFVVGGATAALIFILVLGASGGDLDPSAIELIGNAAQLGAIAVNILYGAIMESSSRQATLGKMAMGLVVTDQMGQPLSFGKALGRNVVKYLSLMCCGLIALTIFSDVYRRGVWDQATSTRVIPKWALDV
jgi:uncharacterized RDD family membrane protein YckC